MSNIEDKLGTSLICCIENKDFRTYLKNASDNFSEKVKFLKIENVPRTISEDTSATLVLQSDENEGVFFDIGKKLKGVFFKDLKIVFLSFDYLIKADSLKGFASFLQAPCTLGTIIKEAERLNDSKKKILLIDDSKLVHKNLVDPLKGKGFVVSQAFDGKQGLEMAISVKPDLIIFGHADLVSPDTLSELKDDYPNLKMSQWFLDPLNKNGPDFNRNKSRILDKSDFMEANFLTTSPDVLKFLSKKTRNYFIPNPSDSSFETLKNYNKSCNMDVFFALSHGVHRGVLKMGKNDDRALFVRKLIDKTKNVKFDIYGINKVQPIWADHYFKTISNSKMGLNLSRGEPIKYYSSDRITQIIGNGLVTLIDEKTGYQDFFDDNEMVFYRNVEDLSEKISRISQDEKLRKKIGKKGRAKYLKYFNSTLVAEFILNKTFDVKSKNKYLWNSDK